MTQRTCKAQATDRPPTTPRKPPCRRPPRPHRCSIASTRSPTSPTAATGCCSPQTAPSPAPTPRPPPTPSGSSPATTAAGWNCCTCSASPSASCASTGCASAPRRCTTPGGSSTTPLRAGLLFAAWCQHATFLRPGTGGCGRAAASRRLPSAAPSASRLIQTSAQASFRLVALRQVADGLELDGGMLDPTLAVVLVGVPLTAGPFPTPCARATSRLSAVRDHAAGRRRRRAGGRGRRRHRGPRPDPPLALGVGLILLPLTVATWDIVFKPCLRAGRAGPTRDVRSFPPDLLIMV
jgi:hypothetical protein